jgi:hypothetical protein
MSRVAKREVIETGVPTTGEELEGEGVRPGDVNKWGGEDVRESGIGETTATYADTSRVL